MADPGSVVGVSVSSGVVPVGGVVDVEIPGDEVTYSVGQVWTAILPVSPHMAALGLAFARAAEETERLTAAVFAEASLHPAVQWLYPCPDPAEHICDVDSVEDVGAHRGEVDEWEKWLQFRYECGQTRLVHTNTPWAEILDLAASGHIESGEPIIESGADITGGVTLAELIGPEPHLTGRVDVAIAAIDSVLGDT